MALSKYQKISLAITLFIAVMIFYVSSLTFAPGKPGLNFKAILYHVTVFFFLSSFLFLSSIKRKNFRLIPIAVTVLILYAISDELHQFFVPGRAFTLEDIFIDTVGITFALMIYSIRILLVKKSRSKSKNTKPLVKTSNLSEFSSN